MVDRRNTRKTGYFYNINNRKTKYTASDCEIISDLDKLMSFSQETPKNHEDASLITPKKRQRKSAIKDSINETYEKDVVEALALLILSSSKEKN